MTTTCFYSRSLRNRFVAAVGHTLDRGADLITQHYVFYQDIAQPYPRDVIMSDPDIQRDLITRQDLYMEIADDLLCTLNYLQKLGHHSHTLYELEHHRLISFGREVSDILAEDGPGTSILNISETVKGHMDKLTSHFNDRTLASLHGVDMKQRDAQCRLRAYRHMTDQELYDRMEWAFCKIYGVRLDSYPLSPQRDRNIQKQIDNPQNRKLMAARVASHEIRNFFPDNCIDLPRFSQAELETGRRLADNTVETTASSFASILAFARPVMS